MSKLLVVVALLSGCSIAFQSKPAKSGLARTECSTSSLPWIVDAAISASLAVAGSATYVVTADTGNADLGASAAGVAVLTSVVYLASAGNGKRWRSECEAGEPAHVAAR